ncbi:MAG: hypothetical protein BWX80_01748 [Candidatus Hydrogenedentes bacterium ADurb.Bin101]|nr:MAG: hypothetical protein BWX80_01748 [Candidatus Hydrogenedentes bacterium ADurb.Bin101]
MAGAIGNGATHFAHILFLQFLQAFIEAIRGRTEPGHAGFFAQCDNGLGVGKGTCQWLVDKDPFPSLEHRPNLLQMGPPVHAGQQHRVHHAAEFFDGGNDFDAKVLFQLFCVAIHTRGAGFQVGAAALVRGNNFAARHMVGIFGVIQ